MPYYEKRTYSGKLLELERYYATDGGRPVGSTNTQISREDQDKLNDVQSWRMLVRMINCNFSHEAGDLCVTLTFRRYMSREAARKQYSRFLRKMRDIRKKRELTALKYILIDEVQSGRQHAHIVISGGVSLEEMTAVWDQLGTVSVSVLDGTNNYKELAAYLLKQHKTRRGSQSDENTKGQRKRNERRWTCSRNLEKPVVKKRKCRPVTINTMPRAPKGYDLLPDFQRDADRYGNMWIRWTCIRQDAKEKGAMGYEVLRHDHRSAAARQKAAGQAVH